MGDEYGHTNREWHQRLITLGRVTRTHDNPHQHEGANEFGNERMADGQIGLNEVGGETVRPPDTWCDQLQEADTNQTADELSEKIQAGFQNTDLAKETKREGDSKIQMTATDVTNRICQYKDSKTECDCNDNSHVTNDGKIDGRHGGTTCNKYEES